MLVALDYLLPTVGEFHRPDLVLSGPNFGPNMGAFAYQLSGTIATAYVAVERGIPGIAFSANSTVMVPYTDVMPNTTAGLEDPATIYGRLAANLAQGLIDKAKGGAVLPPGYGLSVNMPYVTSLVDDSCVNPPFVLARQAGGGATVQAAAYNESSGLFTSKPIVSDAINLCINGDCSLPGESAVLAEHCESSVVVFSVDYDAPVGGGKGNPNPYAAVLSDIVQLDNATTKSGALGASPSVAGTSGAMPSMSMPASTGGSPAATTAPAPPPEADRRHCPDAGGRRGRAAVRWLLLVAQAQPR